MKSYRCSRALAGVWVAISFLGVSLEASPLHPRAAPLVVLDSGTFTGASAGVVSKFLGIPFAETTGPPNRFQLPIPVPAYNGSYAATSFGDSCPQQALLNLATLLAPISANIIDLVEQAYIQIVTGPISEDCLSVNVWAPASASPGDKLPVVAWIYGGAFEFGSASDLIFDGTPMVTRSIALGQPIIFVSMNYRVAGWGFLASQEVKDAGVGNLGLQDQRLALKWIQKYISNFGGDPTKVTIWGESSGAISVAMHMLTNGGDTEGLFRGAFMQAGGPSNLGDITRSQPVYDMLVQETGCSGSNDTLDCLRNVPANALQIAMDKSPSILWAQPINHAWQAGVDGVFLKDTPQNLVLQGSVADIPFITGNNDDEGTLFTFSRLNILDPGLTNNFINRTYFPSANSSAIKQLAAAYPDNILAGSPFDTGILNVLTPQFKRLAAFIGDVQFHAPRRFFLGQRASKQPTFSFINKRLKSIPFLGAFHGSDVLQTFISGELQDYLIHFVHDLDPNAGSTLPKWPQYTPETKELLKLYDDFWGSHISLSTDNFRESAIDLVGQMSLEMPL